MDRLEEAVAAFAARRGLWRPGDRLLVAVSGGGDSMALWAVLSALAGPAQLALLPVHVDHGLRPGSAREAETLRGWFRDRWGRELEVLRAAVQPAPGESLEMAARRVRYALLRTRARAWGPDTLIALGHQQDDQAETVLMRVLTGTGITGLAAMRPRQGLLVRPLLGTGRATLRDYLRRQDIPWLEDPTNADPAMLRNRIRHQLLPLIRSAVNPAAVRALAGLADRSAEVADWLEMEAARWLEAHARRRGPDRELDAGFRTLPPALQTAVLLRLARELGLTLQQPQVEGARTGGVNWPRGWRVQPGPDGTLRVRAPAPLPSWDREPPRPLAPGSWPADGGRLLVRQLMPGEEPATGETVLDPGHWMDLGWRFWRPGDRLAAPGLGGRHKKLQDLFTEHRIPPPLRRRWPLVVAREAGGREVVLAVPGLATAAGAAPAPGCGRLGVRFLPPSVSEEHPEGSPAGPRVV
ncbi:MAG: tRNA lysidine(34) synthetase TilS [Firmicutes bacterium]|nr:tRNA lysidine(34) synthetase TilS [Bacillota bacterium]